MNFKLRIVPPGIPPYIVALDMDNCVIGRSPQADLLIDDNAVSRRHARLFLNKGVVYLEDLDSNNGTYLGRHPIANPVVVHTGAVIRLAAGLGLKGSSIEIHLLETPVAATKELNLLGKTVVRCALDVLADSTILPPTIGGEEELRRHAERVGLINDVHATLGNSVSEDALLELILDRVFQYLKPDAGMIFLKNNVGELYEAGKRAKRGFRSKTIHSRALFHELMDEGKALLVRDLIGEERFSRSESLHGTGIRSLVASPLLDVDGTLGTIVLYSCSLLGQFSEEDLELLVQLSAIATLRIRNLRLVDLAAQQLLDANKMLEEEVARRTRDLKDRKNQLETLDGIVKTLNREHTLDKVLDCVLEQGFALFPQAEKGSMLLWDAPSQRFQFVASRGFRDLGEITLSREEALARYTHDAAELAEGVFLIRDCNRLNRDPKFAHLPPVMTLLAMSVMIDDELRGFLVLGNGTDGNAISQSDGQKLSRYRDHAIAAVAKALLLEELEREHAERHRAEKQVLVQEKMAVLGELTGGVAHGINNPNNRVVNGAFNLRGNLVEFKSFLIHLLNEEQDPGGELTQAFLERFGRLESDLVQVEEGGSRIQDFVKDLQLVLCVGDESRRKVDLLERLLAAIHISQARYVDVEFCYEAECSLELECWPEEMTRVFTALIANACQSIQERCQRLQDTTGKLTISVKKARQEAQIAFEDTGCGIPETMRPKVFQASFTTRPDSRLGLGLATSNNIIQKHHGSISLDSEVGKGTRVTIHLPLES